MRDWIGIDLTLHEIMQGASVGVCRVTQNLKYSRLVTRGSDKHRGWHTHIEGCLAEMALAKHFGLFWSKGEIGDPDLLGDQECRLAREHGWDLLLNRDDPPDRRYHLITGSYGHYRYHGWILARDGQRQELWRMTTKPPHERWAYIVPKEELNR